MAKAKKAPDEDRPPTVGETVRLKTSNTVYEVTSVSPHGSSVNLALPGTNLERFRIPVTDLSFVQRKEVKALPPTPKERHINTDGIHGRLILAQHGELE